MSRIKLAVLLTCCILCGVAADLETKPTDAQVEAVTTTKLTPSVEETKSKTEKRDSSDQTGTVFISKPAKEAPFRSIYPSTKYYEPAGSGPIFEPTTVRYTAAEAVPQGYYEKQESSNIRYVPSTALGQRHSAEPGTLQYSQQQHGVPQSSPHRLSFGVAPQVELYQRPASKPPAPQQQSPIYNYAELEPNFYERAGPQQYQLAGTAPTPPQPFHNQRVQYIIAIPLSYMRQLQQQLSSGLVAVPPSTAASTSTSTSSTTTSTTTTPAAPAAAASHPIMQLLGPLARDHQGQYRPYYQSDAASAPTSGPVQASSYGQQYLQIPASVLLAAAQQLQQHHQQHLQHQQPQQLQALYPKVAPTPPSLYQPLIYQAQPQPQLQLQRIYQHSPLIYAEQPMAQQTTLYAYPQHHQQQQEHEPQQHQQQARLLRLGLTQQQQHKYAAAPSALANPTAATATTTTAAAGTPSALVLPTATTAATHEQQHQQHQAPPIAHYNPIYVQAPVEQQQPQHQHQFAILPRFSNNNPKAAYNLAHESTPPIHVVRLSAANALAHQQPLPIHHYHHYQPTQQQQQYYQPYGGHLASYAEEQQQQQQHHQQRTQSPVSPAVIPYFSHPGAVHYGTHLYHPASVTTASTAGIKQQQQQLQLQQQQQQRQATVSTATSGRLPGDNGNSSSSGVKPSTAAANIVKYP